MPYVVLLFWLFGFVLLWKISFPRQDKSLNKDTPGISVIIPARNEEKTLSQLLQSINNQNVKPSEIIVIDDQSEDGTADTAKRYGCRVILSENLPEGWVGYSKTVNEHSGGIYGAHFWHNQNHASYPDAPEDLFSCNGFQGQYVFIIPSYDLVVVRMGLSENWDINTFLKEILSAFRPLEG